MGQKVGGYRRNVPYGKETVFLTGFDQAQSNRKSNKLGWMFDVNPEGRVGWNRGTSGRKEGKYGKDLTEGRRLRKELEEVRRNSGCETNGLGRKGNEERGFTVYGEYTRGTPRVMKEKYQNQTKDRSSTSQAKKRGPVKRIRGKEEREVARDRVVRKYESLRKSKVERKRTNLKERRVEKGLEGERKERRSGLGRSSKRVKGRERCEAITLSGVLPTMQMRVNVLVGELEVGLNHTEIMRNREGLRSLHSKSSRTGRKRLGEMENELSKGKGGYYGVNVTVKGPLDGARRTMTHVIQLGTVPRGTKRARITTTHKAAKTKIGTLGVRVTYCYGRG